MGRITLIFFLLSLVLLAEAYTPRVSSEEKPVLSLEFQLKTYNRAIHRYEKGKALYEKGKFADAVRVLKKTLQTVSDFPEAYELLEKSYQALGDIKKVEEVRAAMKVASPQGPLLIRRDVLLAEIERRDREDPSPRVPKGWGLLGGVSLSLFLIGGMWMENKRIRRIPPEAENPLVLEPFAGDEFERELSALFKLYLALLPFPILFSLLLLLGMNRLYDLLPMILVTGSILDAALWVIFFSNLLDMLKP